MKFNCGAKQHHYSTFDVQCSMLDVHLLVCSMFSLFDVQSVVTKRHSPLSDLSAGCGWLLKMCAGYMSK
jgi:hypothetical protein